MLACSHKYQRQILQTVVVMDLKGLHMGLWNKLTTNFVQATTKYSQDCQPECMGKMFIVNAPMMFTGIWAIVKGWVDEKTRAKISLEGKDFMKQMVELVDED